MLGAMSPLANLADPLAERPPGIGARGRALAQP